MGVRTSPNSSTFSTPKLENFKYKDFDLKLKKEVYMGESEYQTDEMGRITSYKIDNISITYTYEIDNTEIKKWYEWQDDCIVNMVAEVKIGNHVIKVYGTDEIDVSKLVELANTYSMYNDKIWDLLDKYFSGIIIGPMENSTTSRYRGRSHAYEGNSYDNTFHIYTDGTTFNPNIQIHEMAHVIMSALDSEDVWRSNVAPELDKFYDKYKDFIAHNETSSYTLGTPNTSEFFADASSYYFLEPDELKEKAPDLYMFLDMIYGGNWNEL